MERVKRKKEEAWERVKKVGKCRRVTFSDVCRHSYNYVTWRKVWKKSKPFE